MREVLWDPRQSPSPAPDAVSVGAWTPATPLDLTVQRQHLADALRGGAAAPGADALERLLLAFEELVSNGLRHGRAPIQAEVTAFDGCWLLEVSDAAGDSPPTPATGRDPARGGLGLPLVARICSAHGWQTDGLRKTVWALIDHTPADGRDPADPASDGVTQRLAGAIAGLTDALGFTPATRLTGPVGHLASDIVIDLLAVIREALTNVARHARARAAVIEVAVTSDVVTARVTDDGIGMSGAPRDGGLADLRRRAAWHRGSITVGPGRSGGTQLVWTVPNRPTSPRAR